MGSEMCIRDRDLEAGDIEVRLGSTWIPPEVVETFMYGLLNTPSYRKNKIKVLFSPYTAIWSVTGKSADFDNNNAILKYGTHRVNAYKILEESLNLRDVRVLDTVTIDGKETRLLNQKETITAQQKQQAIQDAFQSWIWKDTERREQLVKRYNEKFNAIRPREYDGSHIQFHGMNPEIQLRPHQKNAVARILYGGNTLLGHVVGSGKTVVAQSPSGNDVIPAGGTVWLYTESGKEKKVKVPNFTGCSVSEAKALAQAHNLNIEITGNDLSSGNVKAYRQSEKQGSMVAQGKVVVVSFKNTESVLD